MIYCDVYGSCQGKGSVDDSGLSILLAPYVPMSFDMFQSQSCSIFSFAFLLVERFLSMHLIHY